MQRFLLLLPLFMLPQLALAQIPGLDPEQPLPVVDQPEDVTLLTTPVRIAQIQVNGLKRTQVAVVLRELPFKPGDTVDNETWQFARARLWNSALFDKVHAHLQPAAQPGQFIAVLTLEEIWTLNPLFSFGLGGNVGWLRVGASDSNLLGRFLEAGAQYERFTQYNGFQTWVRNPRLLDQRLDWVLLVERLVRPRPDFADRRLRLATEFSGFLRQDRLRLSGKVEALYDVLLPPGGGDDANSLRDWSVLLEAGVRLGRIDTLRIRQHGVSLEVRSTYVMTDLQRASGFAQGWMEFLALHMLGERWNLGLRVQLGVQGDAPDFLRFYLGGLGQIRGYIDNFAKTGRYALLNAEVRLIAFDSKWFSLVPTVFVDGAVAQSPPLARFPHGGVQPMLSTGGGLRILLPWMVKTGLRLDLALPLVDAKCPQGNALCPGLSVGVYQFF